MERIFSPEAEVEESVTKPGKHVMQSKKKIVIVAFEWWNSEKQLLSLLHELQWR